MLNCSDCKQTKRNMMGNKFYDFSAGCTVNAGVD